MQSRSGGWGAFDADNEALWLYQLPICDFGKVTDEPTADVTAHALEALGARGGLRRLARARARLAARGAGGRRLLVRPLGRQPRLRHRRGPAGARGLRPRRPTIRPSGGPCAGSTPSSRPSGAFGEDIRSYARGGAGAGAAPPRLHRRPGPCSPTSRAEPRKPCPRGGRPSIFSKFSAPTGTGTSSTTRARAFHSIS